MENQELTVDNKTYTIELTRNQLAVISRDCDLLCRLHIGQLNEVASLFIGRIPATTTDESIETYHKLKDALTQLQPLVTGISYPHASLGVGSKQAHPDHAIAYEISGTIENYLHPQRDRDPLKLSPEPLPKVRLLQVESNL